MKSTLIIALLFFGLFNNIPLKSQSSDSIYFKDIEKYLYWENKPEKFSISSNEISISAGANTNLFNSADGWLKVNTATVLAFKADSNFIFRAKIDSKLSNKWDGAALVVKYDNEHWGKLCFEKDYTGKSRIVSVVNHKVSDDCNSEIIETDFVYLEIAKKGDVVYFYKSNDNQNFYLIRNFVFPYCNIKVGFLSQSPAGNGNTAFFSEINYSHKEMSDFWMGK